MMLYDKLKILVEDFGMDRILEDNDLTEEEVLELLVNAGLIDLNLYFEEENET